MYTKDGPDERLRQQGAFDAEVRAMSINGVPS